MFDFDERPEGNLEPTPRFWRKIDEAGFPQYAIGSLDEEHGQPKPCFELRLNGGNLGYEFLERRIAAFPGSDHKISAYVKTEQLKYARGVLTAFYMDRFGKVLEQTRRYSQLIGPSQAGDPEWRHIEFELPFNDPEGRFIGLSIFLVQQDRIPSELAPAVKSYRKDIEARIYVDNLAVVRLPSCRLAMPEGRCVYHADEPVIVQGLVADPSGEDLEAKITITDLVTGSYTELPHTVRILPHLEQILQGKKEPPSLINHDLGCLKPGTYKIVMQVTSDKEVIVMRERQIAVVEPVAAGKPLLAGQFGIELCDTDRISAEKTIELVTQLGVSWGIVPIWRAGMNVAGDGPDQDAGDSPAILLNRAGVRVIGAYMGTPANLVASTGLLNPSIWDLFSSDRKGWESELSLVLSRHADRIDQWALGQTDDLWQMPDSRIGSVLKNLRAEFSQFQGQFELIANWPAMVDPPTDLGADGLIIHLPKELTSQSYEDFLQPWAQSRQRVWLVFPRPDLDRFELASSLVDFCRRVLYAKRFGFDRIGVGRLWQSDQSHGKSVVEPTPEFPVYANLVRRLSDRTYVGQVSLSDDVGGWLFSGKDGAVMVLLSDGSETISSKVVLGEKLVAYDMWGRQLPVKMAPPGWQLAYDRLAFVEGIDADLARFVSSVHFTPAKLDSRLGSHVSELTFSNVFGQGISGEVRFYGESNWMFDPPGGRFALPSGRAIVLPMKIRYPANAPVGGKLITVRFTLETRQTLTLDMLVPLEIDLSDLEMHTLWFLRGDTVVVSQEIRNVGKSWVDLRAFLVAPQQPRIERPIRQLGPGQTAVREYVLGSWQALHGQALRIGFSEVRGGGRMVNQIITLE